MSEAFFSVGGKRAVTGRLTIPRYGAWVGDASLADATTVTGECTFVTGDLTLKGYARASRTGTFAGKASARIVGGADGWNKTIVAKGYAHEAGVKLSSVLLDAANACGEKIVVSADKKIGVVWTRRAGRASRVLRLLLGGKWWVDADGITQTSERPNTLIASPFIVIDHKPMLGQFEISTETFKDWMPGRRFKSVTMAAEATISSVSFVLAEGKVRLIVKDSASAEDRLLQEIRSIVRDEVCRLEHGTIVEYKITSAREQEIDASPSEGKSSVWPALSAIKLKAGLLGETVTPTVGAKALIIFMDNDPALYRCIGVEGISQKSAFSSSGNVEVTAGGIFKVNGGGNFVALANLVGARFDTIQANFDAHVHPTGVGPSGPPAAPIGTLASVACTKLKTD